MLLLIFVTTADALAGEEEGVSRDSATTTKVVEFESLQGEHVRIEKTFRGEEKIMSVMSQFDSMNMMNKIKIVSVMAFAACLIGCGGMIKGKAAAETAIVQFHELYNQGKLDEIWQDADAQFRAASTKQKYDDFMGAVHRKLGKVTSTSNAGWNVNSHNLKTTVVMTQNTIFEHGQGTEAFTFAMDGTNAVLVGYNIQSMELITK